MTSRVTTSFDFRRDYTAYLKTGGVAGDHEAGADFKQACNDAYDQGFNDAKAVMEDKLLNCINKLGSDINILSQDWDARINQIEREAVNCALMIAVKIAATNDSANKKFKLIETITENLPFLRTASFITISLPKTEIAAIKEVLEPILRRYNLVKRVNWRDQSGWPKGKYQLNWDEGSITRDPEIIRAKINDILRNYLIQKGIDVTPDDFTNDATVHSETASNDNVNLATSGADDDSNDLIDDDNVNLATSGADDDSNDLIDDDNVNLATSGTDDDSNNLVDDDNVNLATSGADDDSNDLIDDDNVNLATSGTDDDDIKFYADATVVGTAAEADIAVIDDVANALACDSSGEFYSRD